MDPVPRDTTSDGTHPHPLIRKLEADQTEYTCYGCNIVGRGTRFRCKTGCYFDLHEYCATCPSSLSTFMHPQHKLLLDLRQAQAISQFNHVCDVCHDPVKGMFYRCELGCDCEFYVHPLCTQLPETLRHVLDTHHHLQLRTSSPGRCAVCEGQCTSWRYGCATCGISIHIDCVRKPVARNSVPSYGPLPSSSSTERGIPGFGPARQHWPPQPIPAYYYYPHCHGYPYNYGPSPSNYPHYYGYPYNCGPSPSNYNHYNQAPGGVVANGGLGQKMFAIVKHLSLGVVSNVIFGGLQDLAGAF